MMRIHRRSLMIACALLLSSCSLPTYAALDGRHSRDASLFSEADYRQRVTYLAGNALEGRGTGQVGNDKAAEFIAKVFKQYGVQPAGDEGTYFQNFTLQLKSKIDPWTHLSIGTHGRRSRRPARLHRDFLPLPFSASGTFKGQVVFAGYGIVNDEADYNDYGDIDVTDKIVLVLRRGPAFGDFGIRDLSFRSKASRANARDAAALLIVNRDGNDKLYDFQGSGGQAGFGLRSYGLPMLHVTPATADQMLAAAGMPGIEALQKQIDRTHRPASAVLKGVSVRGVVTIKRVDTPVRNVVGLIPGTGPQSDEIIILGAHYDHLGIRHKGEADFNPDKDISNGADDNASGTTLLMTMADAYTRGPPPNRSILLIAFTGEELGLLGSRRFVKHPTVDLDKCIAMFNFDMVGRLKNDRLEVGGMRTGHFEDMIHRISTEYGLTVKDGGGGRGPSDHTNFYHQDIPVLFFFTGLHRQYHRPEDDAPLINYPGAMRVARFAADVIDEVDAQTTPPEFTPDSRSITLLRQRREDEGKPAAKSKPVRLGIRPDVDDRPGVLVAGVSEDSPAQRAGFQEGDRIVRVGENRIATFDDLREALGGFEATDETTIRVRRRGKVVRLAVRFGPAEVPVAARPAEQGRPAGRVQLGVMPKTDDKPGVLVASVLDDSPAARAGLKAGDRIVKIGGTKVIDLEQAVQAVRGFKNGDQTTIRVVRNGRRREVSVQFGHATPADGALADPALERIEQMIMAQLARLRRNNLLKSLLGSRSDALFLHRFTKTHDTNSIDIHIELGGVKHFGALVDVLLKTISKQIKNDHQAFRVNVESSIKLGYGQKYNAEIAIHVERTSSDRVDKGSPTRAQRVKRANADVNHQALDDADDMPSMPPVRLGIMPSYGQSEGEGFEISGVVNGGAAAKAGMKDNDRIYKIGKHKVSDVYSYMDALRSYKPGDVIPVIVIRNGQKVELKVKAQPPKSIEPA